MTDQHFELMQTLQEQREQLARLVWILAPEAYAAQRTLAVDMLDETHQFLQDAIAHQDTSEAALRFWADSNTYVIEKLNAAVVSMPAGDWAAANAALAAEG